MRIAIDARALLPRATGIGTYTRGIAGALAAREGTEVGLFTPRVLPDGREIGPWTVHADAHPFGMIWAQTTLPGRVRGWGADVLLSALTIGPAFTADGPPFVSVVHDLTAWTHPEWHASRTIVGFVPLWEPTARRAARFVCVSHATAKELALLYPEAATRIRVAPNGVEPLYSAGSGPFGHEAVAARRRFAGGEPYVLFLGTLEPRKNVEALVAACERLWSKRRFRADLVLAGGVGWRAGPLLRRIGRSPFRDKIHMAGHVTPEEARDLYRGAEVFVYPSWSEGFGLPVLEAMACGAPVVASTAEALVEVGGDAALYAPPEDAAALARRIEEILEATALREKLRAAGVARAALFGWDRAAEETVAALAEAASEGAP